MLRRTKYGRAQINRYVYRDLDTKKAMCPQPFKLQNGANVKTIVYQVERAKAKPNSAKDASKMGARIVYQQPTRSDGLRLAFVCLSIFSAPHHVSFLNADSPESENTSSPR